MLLSDMTENIDLSNKTQTFQEIYINTNFIKKENEESPTKAKSSNVNLYINNFNIEKNVLKRNINNEFTNSTESSLISIRKIEDLLKTPIKNNKLNDSIDKKDIKKEIPSPVKFSPNNVQDSSTKKKKHYLEENNKCTRLKRRKINVIGEYDQLSNSVKTELYDNSVNGMEHIEMLHDLDSLMDFEEIKIPNFLYSATNNIPHEETTETFKDPEVDPLFINVNDVDNDIKEYKTEEKEEENVKPKSYFRKRKKEICYAENRKKTLELSNNKELPIGIKIALEKLHIMSNIKHEEISESTKKKLYDLKVQIMHNVPPQHKIVRKGSNSSLTKTEKNLFLKYALMKQGTFSHQEDEIIINNWKKFCEVHDWNPKIVEPFIYMKDDYKFSIQSKEERQKFVQFLANGLPCRSLYSVHQRFKNLFKKSEKAHQRYNSIEDEIILSYVKKSRKRKQYSHQFSKLGRMLGRSRNSIWIRYNTLKNMKKNQMKKKSKIQWTFQLIGTLVQSLMDMMLCEKVEELKDAVIPKVIWKKLEQKLNICYRLLHEFWLYRLHMQLFSPESIYLNDIKIKLIEYMYGKGISNTREIKWRGIAKYFEGVTGQFLNKTFSRLMYYASKKLGTANFLDLMKYLYECKIPDIQNSLVDKLLPRLSYDNGNVKIIDEDTNY